MSLNSGIDSSWDINTRTSAEVILPTAQWDQFEPYNTLVPEINGAKGSIGCVATALAIIMKYNEFPKKSCLSQRTYLV